MLPGPSSPTMYCPKEADLRQRMAWRPVVLRSDATSTKLSNQEDPCLLGGVGSSWFWITGADGAVQVTSDTSLNSNVDLNAISLCS